MQLNIVNQVKTPTKNRVKKSSLPHVSGKKLQRDFDQILKILNSKKIRNKKFLKAPELTVVFLPAAQMKKINFKFRNKNKPTDVLSFESQNPESFGELLLCTSVLKKQAKDYGHSFDQELLTMLIHGVLHLLGYDHEVSASEEKVMLSLQNEVLNALLNG